MSVFVQFGKSKTRFEYENVDSARKVIYRWSRSNKNTSATVFRSKTSFKPFAQGIWFKDSEEPTWFKLIDTDIRDECAGCSEDIGKIQPNGKLRR